MASTAQSRIKSISYAKYGYMFIAPFFLVYAFFQVWPLINTFLLSFHGNGGDNQPFVGLENYQTLLFGGDDRRTRAFNVQFFQAFKNTIILWIGNFIPQIFLSLLLAVWFTDSKLHIPGKGAFKVIMYLPNIITAVSVAALFMRFMSNTDTCAANTILGMMGKDTIKFENDPTWSRGIVMFIQTWLWFGNTMIMMMSPMVVYTLFTSMIGGLQMFDIPFLYHTAAGDIKDHLRTVAVFVYEQFRVGNNVHSQQYGIAGAASMILFVITVILGSFVFMMNRDADEARKKKERKELVKAYKRQQKLAKNGGVDI